MKPILFLLGIFMCINISNAQNIKQVLDARVKGITTAEDCKKLESLISNDKNIIKCYTVFKGGESKITKLVVEVLIKETGENDVNFCSEDLKKILVKNGYEMVSIKETTLNKNEEYPNYDKR